MDAETRFKRFLHYASEDGLYVPGNRYGLHYYSPDRVPSLSELIENDQISFIINTISKVHQSKSSPYPEAVIFVLAQCARYKNPNHVVQSNKISFESKKLIETVCSQNDSLLLFFKFACEHRPKLGSGRAVKKIVSDWYLKKSALELAELIAMRPKVKGWKHSDLIKLAHVHSREPAKAAVLKYARKGLESATQEFDSNPDTAEVLSYLKTVEEFKKSNDPFYVARKIESYSLTIRHVNFQLLTSKEVWIALIPHIPLDLLLDHFQFLSRYKLFRSTVVWDTDFVRSVADAMGNPASVKASGLTPSRVYIELCKYKNNARLKLDLGVKLHRKPAKTPPQVCPDLVKALEKLFRASFKNVKSTGKRYLVAIDLSEKYRLKACGHLRSMTISLASTLIAYSLVRTEKNVEVMSFGETTPTLTFNNYTITPEMSIDAAHLLILGGEATTGSAEVKKLIQWATKKKKEYDMIIVLGGFIKHNAAGVLEEMTKYRQAVKIPDAKLVIGSLSGTPKPYSGINDPKVLTVSGFDDKVFKLITSFALGEF